MESNEALDLQRDSQFAGSDEEAHAAQIEGRLKNLHTCMPGIIVSFNPTKQTAVVQPAIKRIFVEQGAVNLPVCTDVPVMFPGGKGYFVTFPVEPGAECLLLFSERAIDFWFQAGNTQQPAEDRMHDLSDGIAIVGLRSQPNSISAFNNNALEIRSSDGTKLIQLSATGILIKGNVTVQGNLTSTGTITGNTVVTNSGIGLGTHKHTGVQTGSGTSGGPTP